MSAEDFLIAADLTLYSNPLNRALIMPAAEPKAEVKAKAQEQSTSKVEDKKSEDKQVEKAKQGKKDDEWIASDMTKYDDPMAELDRSFGGVPTMGKRSVVEMEQELIHSSMPEAEACLDDTSDPDTDVKSKNLNEVSAISTKTEKNEK